jgi:uncharacterized CHY-type Zn-finger protein
MLSTVRRQRILNVTKNIDYLMRRRYNRRRIYRHKKQFANILVDEKDVKTTKTKPIAPTPKESFESLQQDCSICLENMTLQDAQNISCGHVFHQTCIRDWSKQAQNFCPLCRTKFIVVTNNHTSNYTSNHHYPRSQPIIVDRRSLIDRDVIDIRSNDQHNEDSQSRRDRHVIVID